MRRVEGCKSMDMSLFNGRTGLLDAFYKVQKVAVILFALLQRWSHHLPSTQYLAINHTPPSPISVHLHALLGHPFGTGYPGFESESIARIPRVQHVCHHPVQIWSSGRSAFGKSCWTVESEPYPPSSSRSVSPSWYDQGCKAGLHYRRGSRALAVLSLSIGLDYLTERVHSSSCHPHIHVHMASTAGIGDDPLPQDRSSHLPEPSPTRLDEIPAAAIPYAVTLPDGHPGD